MIKIIFFDVDGTLFELGHKEISDKTLYTLKELKKNGFLLCMATGRSNAAIPKFEGFEFDIYLSFNGSYIRNVKEVIYKNPLNFDDVQIIINNLKKMNKAIAIGNETDLVANGTDTDLTQYFQFGNNIIHIAENFDELCKADVYQIMCSARKHEYDQILENTKYSMIAAWWDRAIDIIPSAGGKGIAVQKVLDFYNFTTEESLAFGDGENDLDMLQVVGTGVAMGNATELVKAHADEVCLSVAEDGIYHYCVENELIQAMQ